MKRLFLSSVSEWREEKGMSSGWREARRRVLERDSNSCVRCGFSAPKFMEAHHLEGRNKDDSLENLAVHCPLCHSCMHIGFSGLNRRGLLMETDGETRQEKLNRFLLESAAAGMTFDVPEEIPVVAAEKLKLVVKEIFDPAYLATLADVLLRASEETGKTILAPAKYIYFPYRREYPMFDYLLKEQKRR